MKPVERLELPLWELLQAAAIAPDAADVRQLLDGLEVALLELDTSGQLQVAADAIQQIVQVFQERSVLAFEELDATNSEEGPGMPTDAFDRYVRQTMEVDFESLIAPLVSLPRKIPERQVLSDAQSSVVGELDRVAVLQALDEQMSQHPELTEMDVFNQTIALAHDEDVSSWAGAIAQRLQQVPNQAIQLDHLWGCLDLAWSEVWLGALLGGFDLEQRGPFYQAPVWVRDVGADPNTHC